MSSFKDAQGREWSTTITVGAVFRIRDQTGKEDFPKVDLLEPGKPISSPGGEAGLPLSVALQVDERLFVGTLWALIEPEAKKLAVEPEALANALDGTAYTAALDAFFQDWEDFFLKRRAPAQAKAIRAAKQVIETAQKSANASVAGIDVEAEIERLLISSGSSPESSGSTPGLTA